MAVAAKDYIGRILGGYRLVELLGAGGAGAVFLGERLDDSSIQRAIKVLMPDDDLSATETSSFQARFMREAQAASQLHHVHILPILSYHAEVSGLSYMELPLMAGGTLAGRIAAGPIPLDDVASYLRQIASALDYAHRQGVIHRDVKAVNVLLDQHGEAYLADFGIARIFERSAQHLDNTDATPLTQQGQIIGTPACMAPEQFTGGAISPQLDIYALGVLAWQLVTGSLPFVASDPLQLALQHLNTPPPSARAFRPELPEPADAALRKALAKHPQDRFDSAGTFATAFSDGLHGDWHPALSQPAATNHTLDTTLSGPAISNGTSGATRAADAAYRTASASGVLNRLTTRKLPENQPHRHIVRTILLALALLVVVLGSATFVLRILPAIPAFATHPATPFPSPHPSPTPTTTDALQPLVRAGSSLYTTNAPGDCDTSGAAWFTNAQGQQQCGGDETTLIGANCACPLALVKLQQIPGATFPDSYVIQARMQSIGASRTDYFGFKFREQASTTSATNFGGYGFLVNANGEWEFNRYDLNGHRDIRQRGELPTPLVGPHVYDLTVNGGDFTFAVDGQAVAFAHDTTYSGGIVDLAAEPRCVIFITGVALYALP